MLAHALGDGGKMIRKLKANRSYMRSCQPKQNKKLPSNFFHTQCLSCPSLLAIKGQHG